MKKPRPYPFLIKLRKLFALSEKTGTGSWSADGTRFEVRDRAAFKKDVFAVYGGKDEKRTERTFYRQLQIYRFQKCRVKENEVVVWHPNFFREMAESPRLVAERAMNDEVLLEELTLELN